MTGNNNKKQNQKAERAQVLSAPKDQDKAATDKSATELSSSAAASAAVGQTSAALDVNLNDDASLLAALENALQADSARSVASKRTKAGAGVAGVTPVKRDSSLNSLTGEGKGDSKHHHLRRVSRTSNASGAGGVAGGAGAASVASATSAAATTSSGDGGVAAGAAINTEKVEQDNTLGLGGGLGESSRTSFLSSPRDIASQGLAGISRLNAVKTEVQGDSAHGAGMLHLSNGQRLRLRQLLPEVAQLSPEMEKRLESEFEAGFAHYADEMLLTHSIEDLGGRPYGKLSPDFIKQLLQEHQPQLQTKYPFKILQLFTEPPELPFFQECLDFMIKDAHRELINPNELNAPHPMSIYYFYEVMQEHPQLLQKAPDLDFLYRNLLDYLCYYEWFLAALVLEFDSLLSAQNLDDLIFYHYLLAQTSQDENDFIKYENLVTLQNLLKLFRLMRFGFVNATAFVVGVGYGKDAPEARVSRSADDPSNYPHLDLRQTYNHLVGPDIYLGHELSEQFIHAKQAEFHKKAQESVSLDSAQAHAAAAATLVIHELELRLASVCEAFSPQLTKCTKASQMARQQLHQEFNHKYYSVHSLNRDDDNSALQQRGKHRNNENSQASQRDQQRLSYMEKILIAVDAVRNRYGAFYNADLDKQAAASQDSSNSPNSQGHTTVSSSTAVAVGGMGGAAAWASGNARAARAAQAAQAAQSNNAEKSVSDASSGEQDCATDNRDDRYNSDELLRRSYKLPSLADLDMRCAYTTVQEMRDCQPILLHFCYLRSALDYLELKGEDEALANLVQQIAFLLSYRAEMRFYGDYHQSHTFFISPLSNFLWGRKACRLGYAAMQDGSTKVSNKDTLGIFLYELFNNVSELTPEQKCEYDLVHDKFTQKEIDEAIKSGECSDQLKEGALHLYHQLKLRQQLTDPMIQLQILKNDNPLIRICPFLANKLVDLASFYSKYKINIVRKVLMEGGDEHSSDIFTNKILERQYYQVQATAGAFGLDGNGNFIRDRKTRQNVAEAVLQKSEHGEVEHFLMGDTGFMPIVPGTSGYVAFLLGRAYTFGEMVDLNRYWGYAALVYAAVNGEYRAPSYLSLYYEPFLTSATSYQGLNVLALHLMGCMGLALSSVSLNHVAGAFHLINCYEQSIRTIDYNTAFKLWQERDSLLQPIFASNPTLLRREKLELLAREGHHPAVSSALIANTAILLCDLLERYPSAGLKDKLEATLDRVLLMMFNTMHQTFSPDCCLALFRLITFYQFQVDLHAYRYLSDLNNSVFLGKLITCQLFFGEKNIPDCSVVDSDLPTIHLAMMFLQLGMVSPEYREQGYNLLSLMLHSGIGNLSSLMVPYMDGYFKDAAVLQNGAAFSYLSAVNKVQHGAFPDATSTVSASCASSVGSAGSASSVSNASNTAATGGDSGGAGASADGATAGSEASLDCHDASVLFALLGRRFLSDACYQDAIHYYQQQGLDGERLKLAYEMVAMRRPYGYFELYLNLKDREDLRAEAHTYLFYAVQMQVSEAQAEYDALLRTKSFKPLPFLIYWLYLEELAKSNVSALLCLLYLQISGLVMPINSHKIDDLIQRHQQFFTQSQLNSILQCRGQSPSQTLQNWYRQSAFINYLDFFNQEDDNAYFMANEIHGNAAFFNAFREYRENMTVDFFVTATNDPQVMAILLKMIERLGMGKSPLERAILIHLQHNSSAWPEPLPQSLNQASEKAAAMQSFADSSNLDILLTELTLYCDHLYYNLNVVSPLSSVLPQMVHPTCDHPLYKKNLQVCFNLGVMPNNLTALFAYTQKAVRDDHRPLPLLFGRMCRFISNLGYLLPRFYSHSNMLYLSQEPYGELFERLVLQPFYRDLEQGAPSLGPVAQQGELLRRLMLQLQMYEMHYAVEPESQTTPVAPDVPLTSEAKAKAKATAVAAGAATATASTVAVKGGAAKGHATGNTAGVDAERATSEGGTDATVAEAAAGAVAGAATGAAIEVEASETHSVFDELMKSLMSLSLFLPEELMHLQVKDQPLILSDFVAAAHDFVSKYQDAVATSLNDVTSLEYDDYIYLIALFGAPLHLHANYQELMQHISHYDHMDTVVRAKPCFVHFGDNLALDLQRFKYNEYVAYAEVLKSYSVKYGQLLKYEQQIPRLKLQLPAIRFGLLGLLDLSSVAEDKRHEMELFLHAYLQYEYFLHSHGFDLREMLLFARNGWTLGKTSRARMPQRSYASLLAKDMLRGVPEAAERYMYYRQSHLFKYVLDHRYFHEDEQHRTARKFVQEVLQLDLNSDKFKEFAQNMSSEGFDEFEKLLLEVENGAIENRYRFKYEAQDYDYLSGYISKSTTQDDELYHGADADAGVDEATEYDEDVDDGEYADDGEDAEHVGVNVWGSAVDGEGDDPFALDSQVACRAREQLKQMASAVDALQACPPGCRELYFTRSDEQLRGKQTNNVLSWTQLSPDVVYDTAFYKWNAVELRVQLERVLGKDNIELLVHQPFASPCLPYSFAHDGSVDLHQLLKTMPYPCTLLPSCLLTGLDVQRRKQALAYMASLNQESVNFISSTLAVGQGALGASEVRSPLGSATASTAATVAAQGSELAAHAATTKDLLANKLIKGDLYAVELWGMSFDQRLSRWQRSKSELMVAIGREYSSYQQDFLRLRTYNSVYSEPQFQRYSFIWHLQRLQQQQQQQQQARHNRSRTDSHAGGSIGSGVGVSGGGAVAGAVLGAAAAVTTGVGTPMVAVADSAEGDANVSSTGYVEQGRGASPLKASVVSAYDQELEHSEPWWELAENELLSAIQNGEEYQGKLFNLAEYSEESLQSAKRQAQANGQSFPSSNQNLGLNPSRSEAEGSYRVYDDYSARDDYSDYGAYGDYSDSSKGQQAPAVVLTTRTADKVAAVHEAKVQVGATASFWNSTNIHQARTLRQLLEYLGLDLDRVDISVKDQEAVTQSLDAAFNIADAPASHGAVAATKTAKAAKAAKAATVSADGATATAATAAAATGGVDVGAGTSMSGEEALLFGRLKNFLTNKLGINIDHMGHDAIAAYAIEHLSGVEGKNWSAGASVEEGQGEHQILRDEWDGDSAAELFKWLNHFCHFDLRQERQFTRPLMFYEEENPLHVLIYCLSQASTSGLSFMRQTVQEAKLADCLTDHSYFYGAADLIDMSFVALLYSAHRIRFYRSLTYQQALDGIEDLYNMYLYGLFSPFALEQFENGRDDKVSSHSKKLAADLKMPENSPPKLLSCLLRLASDNLLSQCSSYCKSLLQVTKEQYRRGLHVLLDDSYIHPLFFSLFDDKWLSLHAPSVWYKLYSPAFSLVENILHVVVARRQSSQAAQGALAEQGVLAFPTVVHAFADIVRKPDSLLLHSEDDIINAQVQMLLQGQTGEKAPWWAKATSLDAAVTYDEYLAALRTLRIGLDGSYQRLPDAVPLSPSKQALNSCRARGKDFCQWVSSGKEIFINEDLLDLYPDNKLPQMRELVVKLTTILLFGSYEDERQLRLHQDLLPIEDPRKKVYPLCNGIYYLNDEDEAEEHYRQGCLTSNISSMLISAQGKFKGKFDLSLPQEQVVSNALAKMGLSAQYQALCERRGQEDIKSKGHRSRRALADELVNKESKLARSMRLAKTNEEKERIISLDALLQAKQESPDRYLELLYLRWKYYLEIAYKNLQQPELLSLSGYYSNLTKGCANLPLFKDRNMQHYVLAARMHTGVRVPFVPESLAHMLEKQGVPPARYLNPLSHIYRVGMRTGMANISQGYLPIYNGPEGLKMSAWTICYPDRTSGKLYEQVIDSVDRNNMGEFVDQYITCYYSMAYLHGLLLSPEVRALNFLNVLPAQTQEEGVDFVRWLDLAHASLPARMFFDAADNTHVPEFLSSIITTPIIDTTVTDGAYPAVAPTNAATATANAVATSADDDNDYLDDDDYIADDDDDDDDGETIVLSAEQAERLQDFLERHHIDPFDTEGLANALVQCHLAQMGEQTDENSVDFDENQALSDIEQDNAAYERSKAVATKRPYSAKLKSTHSDSSSSSTASKSTKASNAKKAKGAKSAKGAKANKTPRTTRHASNK